MSRQQRCDLRNGLLFVSPWLIGLVAWELYPILASLYYSLCEYSVLTPAAWIGLDNYRDLFTDEVFWKALSNTGFYAAFALPLDLICGIALALLLNTKVRGMVFYRAIFFVPSLVPMIALAILWLWMFNAQYGVVNYALGAIGLPGPRWLVDPAWAKPALVLMSLWGIGRAVVVYLAGLQDVPVHLYESADLDGASWHHKIRHITLPMISPVIYFNLILGIIGVMQVFAVPYVMTGGGPARATLFYTMYLYDNAFTYLRMGYACAMAWMLFLLILGLTLIATKVSERHVYYAGK
ncbi:MAG: sugar ABC transporter permease [Candidatus Latescibacteria bacterium]|nr:sugar ABC transporter permease [Candidatus Latescibacterota bacterium]